jgi:hypothetical protein
MLGQPRGPHGAVWGEIMRCIGIGVLAVLLCVTAAAKAEVVVNISKSQQRLSVVVDGAEAYRWPVSTGRRGHATPSGIFHPIRLERHWYSHEYSMTPMPWAMFFHRGYAVHGTMEAYNLGHAASHGCVRLRPDNAAILFSLVRHQGIKNVTFDVLNGPLPAAPGAVPMADAETPAKSAIAQMPAAEHFAKALDDIDAPQSLSAKTHQDADPQSEGAKPAAVKHTAQRGPDAANYRVSIGSDEAKILRERQAWLRSLDRKYGIVR